MTDLLRDELGFEGLIMTDDLDMGAILNEYGLEETIRLAIGAGNDLAMICHRVPAIEEALNYLQQLPRPDLDRALASVARLKSIAPPTNSPNRLSPRSTTRSGTCVLRFSARSEPSSSVRRRQTFARGKLLAPFPPLAARSVAIAENQRLEQMFLLSLRILRHQRGRKHNNVRIIG